MKAILTRSFLVALSVCGLACEEESALQRVREQKDTYNQSQEPKVDVLWVIDNSQTMTAEQQKIVEQTSSFFAGLLARALDYHMAVVTTDPADQGRLRAYQGPAVPGCDHCRFVSRATVCEDPSVTGTEDEVRARCPALAVFRNLALVGNMGTASERGFEQGASALGISFNDQKTGLPIVDMQSGKVLSMPPAENAGFLREDADLMLIFVSDEDEGLKAVGGPVRYYERLFTLLKGQSDRRVSVNAIIGWPIPEQGALANTVPVEGACEHLAPLWDGNPNNDAPLLAELKAAEMEARGCLDLRSPNAEDAFAETGLRYLELSCRLGGAVANICAENYQATFQRLTDAAVALGRSFPLRFGTDLDSGADCTLFTDDDPRLDCDGNGALTDPIDGPICVRATPEKGTLGLIPRDPVLGWTWDAANRAVTFKGTVVPAPTTEIELRYRVAPQMGACR